MCSVYQSVAIQLSDGVIVKMVQSSLKKILVRLLSFALFLSGLLVLPSCGKQGCPNPFPMWVKAPTPDTIEFPESIQMEYAGCSFDFSSGEEEVTVQVACTLTERSSKWTNYFVLYQEDGSSGWHLVFATEYAVKAANIMSAPGTETVECVVPKSLFSHKGAYKIGIAGWGICALPREELWEGTDIKCTQREGFHTASGFPMYRDTRLAGPPDAQPGAELIGTERKEGAGSDTLSVTVNMQKPALIDEGFYQILYCPQGSDRVYCVYHRPESFFYDFEPEVKYRQLSSGENTLEYSVPKGLFEQKGRYYLLCTLGGLPLFEK